MKRVIGHLLSYIEEFSFLGSIAAIICMIVWHAYPADMYDGFLVNRSIIKYFFAYMLLSLVIYPIVLVISVICEKTGWLYEGQYSDNDIWYDFYFNIWNDLVFPIYAFKNRKNAPKAVTVSLILWILVVAFLIIGFKFTYFG